MKIRPPSGHVVVTRISDGDARLATSLHVPDDRRSLGFWLGEVVAVGAGVIDEVHIGARVLLDDHCAVTGAGEGRDRRILVRCGPALQIQRRIEERVQRIREVKRLLAEHRKTPRPPDIAERMDRHQDEVRRIDVENGWCQVCRGHGVVGDARQPSACPACQGAGATQVRGRCRAFRPVWDRAGAGEGVLAVVES